MLWADEVCAAKKKKTLSNPAHPFFLIICSSWIPIGFIPIIGTSNPNPKITVQNSTLAS
jgi:hypothetical protein